MTEFLNLEIDKINKRNLSKTLIEIKFSDNFLSNKPNKKDEKERKKNPMSDIYKGDFFYLHRKT